MSCLNWFQLINWKQTAQQIVFFSTIFFPSFDSAFVRKAILFLNIVVRHVYGPALYACIFKCVHYDNPTEKKKKTKLNRNIGANALFISQYFSIWWDFRFCFVDFVNSIVFSGRAFVLIYLSFLILFRQSWFICWNSKQSRQNDKHSSMPFD